MRITFITPSDSLTGGMRVIATYARLLQQRGHEVAVISNAPDRPSFRDRLRSLRQGHFSDLILQAPQAPGHIAMSGVPWRVLERPRPIEAQDLPDADVLVATWWETALWADAMPADKGRKVHLIQGNETWAVNGARDRVHAALRLPNCKLAVSSGLAREIQDELGDLPITVVPNAVDTSLFKANPRTRGEPPVVGYVYSPAPFKGADLCARACELARLQIPGLRILAFGSDEPTPEMPLASGASFILRPAQEQLPSFYAQCDAWLFASRKDSFGLPILEAMACRTPVIGVPVGAAPELLGDGAGLLVPAKSPRLMAQALVDLLGGPAQRWCEASERAHERARSRSWDESVDLFLEAISDERVQ